DTDSTIARTFPHVVSLAPAMTDTTELVRRLASSGFGVLPREELLRGSGLDDASQRSLDLARRVYDQLLDASATRRADL
ncbi:MAG: hypothetical protein HKN17_07665, partial [Rhodothermales bacterium]|nr:hypothetical protein [Rhodothermales bacterium]